MAVGDFNNDGHLDLISGKSTAGSGIHIALGNGDGTFKATTNIAGAALMNDVEVGDINGDGHLDIVSESNSTDIHVWLGNGNGTFQADVNYGTGGTAFDHKVGDLNGDGRADVVYTHASSSELYVRLGQANGTLGGESNYATGGSFSGRIILKDVTGDGNLDALVGDEAASETIHIFTGTGSGTFNAAIGQAITDDPDHIDSGDINGDGHLDLVYSDQTTNQIYYLTGDSTGSFGGETLIVTESHRYMMVEDLNGDGAADIILADDIATDSASVIINSGVGTFEATVSYSSAGNPLYVQTGDFNGDGAIDIVSQNGGNDFGIFIANTQQVGGLGDFNLLAASDARSTLDSMATSLSSLAEQRGEIGATMARVQTAISNNLVARENSAAAAGRILDADIALEAADATKLRILREVGAAILTQANLQSSLALRLIS